MAGLSTPVTHRMANSMTLGYSVRLSISKLILETMMTKISINTIKEAAKSASELMDASAPEVKMLLENPNFAVGLCLVLHKEVAELRQQLQELKGNPAQNVQPNLSNPPQNSGNLFQIPAKAPETNPQPEAPPQSAAPRPTVPAPSPQENSVPQQVAAKPQLNAPPVNFPQFTPPPVPQPASQEMQPVQYRAQNTANAEDKKELFA
jgi:hypothetical protein